MVRLGETSSLRDQSCSAVSLATDRAAIVITIKMLIALQEKAVQHPAAARASFFLQIGLRSFAGGNPAAALTRLQVAFCCLALLCIHMSKALGRCLLSVCKSNEYARASGRCMAQVSGYCNEESYGKHLVSHVRWRCIGNVKPTSSLA